MTNRSRTTTANDLQEVTTRHRAAQALTEVLAAKYPADSWQNLHSALADIPALATEITRLRTGLAGARLGRANLAAAALAAIIADYDIEPDPLCYLRDELRAQGHDVASHQGRR